MTTPATLLLNLAGFRGLCPFPADVDLVEESNPGYIERWSAIRQGEIYDRLRKRYAVPFDANNPPAIMLKWLVFTLVLDVLTYRGYNPQSPDALIHQARYDESMAQQKEAADAKDGLFELPLLNDEKEQGVSRGGPIFYTESSPFVAADRQECEGRLEDEFGFGTYGGE